MSACPGTSNVFLFYVAFFLEPTLLGGRVVVFCFGM